jgi:DNA polymerase
MNRRDLFLKEMGITQWVEREDAGESALESALESAQAPQERRTHIAGLEWSELEAEALQCTACGLSAERKQVVFGTGVREGGWVLVGEAPGAEEDARGQPFVGQAGKLLDNMLAAVRLSREEQVYIVNVLKCRPPANRDPQPAEVVACEPWLLRQLELLQPRIVVLLGRFAAQSLLATDASISKLRGQVHHMRVAGRNVPVIVTYHPAYLLRNLPDKAKAWEDWNLALDAFSEAHALQ